MNLLPFRIAASLQVVAGVGHLTFSNITSTAYGPRPATEEVMSNDIVELLWTRHSQVDLTYGYSQVMGLSGLLAGVLFLLIARLAADSPERARGAAVVGLVASVVELAISVAFLTPPPIILSALATIGFAAALVLKAQRRVSVPQ